MDFCGGGEKDGAAGTTKGEEIANRKWSVSDFLRIKMAVVAT